MPLTKAPGPAFAPSETLRRVFTLLPPWRSVFFIQSISLQQQERSRAALDVGPGKGNVDHPSAQEEQQATEAPWQAQSPGSLAGEAPVAAAYEGLGCKCCLKPGLAPGASSQHSHAWPPAAVHCAEPRQVQALTTGAGVAQGAAGVQTLCLTLFPVPRAARCRGTER